MSRGRVTSQGKVEVSRACCSPFLTPQQGFQVWATPTSPFLALLPVTEAVEAGLRPSLGQARQAEGGSRMARTILDEKREGRRVVWLCPSSF